MFVFPFFVLSERKERRSKKRGSIELLALRKKEGKESGWSAVQVEGEWQGEGALLTLRGPKRERKGKT